jgi:hypothetical protein
MSRTLRATLGWLGTFAAITIAGCRDLTAPEGDLTLTVAPDTLRVGEFSSSRITYTVRNSSALAIVTGANPDVQAELSRGTWANVATDSNSLYIQDALGGNTFAANLTEQRMLLRQLAPGHYRLHMTYWRASSSGTKSGPAQEALSNEFDVLP